MKVSGVLSAIAASACLAQASPVPADADKRELNFGGLGPASGLLGNNPLMDAVQQGVAGFFAGGDAVLNGPAEIIRQAMVRISNGEGRSNSNSNSNSKSKNAKANNKRETNLGGLGPLGGALGGGGLSDALQQGIAGLFAGGDAVLNGPGDIIRQALGQVGGNGGVKARDAEAQIDPKQLEAMSKLLAYYEDARANKNA
ncbi:hypothetical protein EsDP_00006715 [Epichloe bromicola]|uniref:Uncharacterized protein n=1 Tax=Epichloe bromicola TaxID=79588 RepID=A0ABQ0CYG5_9HYPO